MPIKKDQIKNPPPNLTPEKRFSNLVYEGGKSQDYSDAPKPQGRNRILNNLLTTLIKCSTRLIRL